MCVSYAQARAARAIDDRQRGSAGSRSSQPGVANWGEGTSNPARTMKDRVAG
ncbi:Uncharacterised protein [Mycobacteroides abscessus subsp. abscessus]|nr:Uncharacterised protein [Mycobacteroides abscessus subsp. abscessus]